LTAIKADLHEVTACDEQLVHDPEKWDPVFG
jgi:hypothetical protein